MKELLLARQDLNSAGAAYTPPRKVQRNLGNAILLAAIEDYLSLEELAHKSAALFLYPATQEYREHFDWVVSLAEGIDPAWLRDALDRFRRRWDRQRFEQMVLRAKSA